LLVTLSLESTLIIGMLTFLVSLSMLLFLRERANR